MRLLGADVYCLQEVQADHFEQWFEPQLDQLGYSGTYKRKTREFMGQYGKMDGCATFWRRDKLAPVDGGLHAVEFNAIAVSKHAPPGQERKRLLNRLLKDNVAQVRRPVRSAQSGAPNPDRPVRIAQSGRQAAPPPDRAGCPSRWLRG